MKHLALAAALAIGASSLSGCAGVLPAPVIADMQTALADICPDVALATPFVGAMNAKEKAAYTVLVNACPPNPAPTSAVVLISDLYADYALIAPLFGAKAKLAPKG